MIKKYAVFMIVLGVYSLTACSPAHTVQGPSAGPVQTVQPRPGSRHSGDALEKFVRDSLLQDSGLRSAQVGISLYDPGAAVYMYNFQGDKYFIPASNTKLFSLYAGLKYLGDSLVGMRYKIADTALLVIPSGDPTFLHPSYSSQPVMDLMKRTGKNIYFADDNWQDNALGKGWAWDDYNDDYSAERSPFPIYGNMVRWVQERQKGNANDPFGGSPSIYSIPEVDWQVKFSTDTTKKNFSVRRYRDQNVYEVTEGKEDFKQQFTPFITDGLASATLLLKDTAGRQAGVKHMKLDLRHLTGWNVLHSRPVDSLFRPMMCNSDNFFAEQTLLMVGNELMGRMNDAGTINYLLHGDLDSLPQRPGWVDGSGLSRNDLFSPQDFIWILDRLQKEFGLARMKEILPTGGTGTLASYRQDSAFIYAKTGSLSGVAALSGYLITEKSHLFIFSILINNYSGSGAVVRRQIEALVRKIRNEY